MPDNHSVASNWICSQIGAREHYAIPRAFQKAGQLRALYTDFWGGPVVQKLAKGKLRPLALRFHPDLAEAKIKSWNLRALGSEATVRRGSTSQDPEQIYLDFIKAGSKFARAVRDDLKRHANLSSETFFFGYDTASLETMEFLRTRGVRCLVGQMDPNRTEMAIVREEEKKWPGWATRPTEVPEQYFLRREKEWALAERIIVNSDFSRRALLEQGVPAGKLTVIPLCYEAAAPKTMKVRTNSRNFQEEPLTILFLGQVILRKGIQYLIEAAKLLQGEPVRFEVVGPIGISSKAMQSAPPNLAFHGQVNRERAAHYYQEADLFVLPTLSDGFAITQVEAMAHGLPVMTTSHCGEVVTHGLDGMLIASRDAEALVGAIILYLENPELLLAHQEAAYRKAGEFTLARLGDHLASLRKELLESSPGGAS